MNGEGYSSYPITIQDINDGQLRVCHRCGCIVAWEETDNHDQFHAALQNHLNHLV